MEQTQISQKLDQNHQFDEEHKYDYDHFITTKKKKQQEDQFQVEFKEIKSKYIGKFDKSELWLFFEYTEFEKDIVYYLMDNYKISQIRQLKRDLLKNPKIGYKNLNEVIKSYCIKHQIADWDEYREERDQKLELEQQTQEEQKNQQGELEQNDLENKNENSQANIQPGFLMITSDVIILQILEYCEPRSLGNLMCTNTKFKEITKSKFLFKKFCMLLYKQGQCQLPEKNYFLDFQNSILNNPLQFSPSYLNQVSNNLRELVWPELKSFKVNVQYYKQFKSWYEMYKSAPRLNYGGIYKIKEKYLQLGEIQINHHYQPILEQDYYRYIRFFPDGSLRYKVSNKKLKLSQILQYFTNDDPQFCKQNFIQQGEYLQAKDKLIFKYCINTIIFEYECTIQHDHYKPNYLLRVEKQRERSSELNHVYNLYELGKFTSEKYYKYMPIEVFREQLKDTKISAVTL